ncbi:MAG: hypothetical protein RMJ43_01935 [Chloroherpetonaceae bacterium]|nr:hypothetical protein [Chthonomonadaceae bacterium]MDW8206567.1 hypothetical protein [Chloroherpetonaceae bacterium]
MQRKHATIGSALCVLALGMLLATRLAAQDADRVEKGAGILAILKEGQKEAFGLKKLSAEEYERLDIWVTDLLVRALQQVLDPEDVRDATIIADDGEILGKISTNRFDRESIANEFGTYGSRFSDKSILNRFGKYGSSVSSTSAFNPVASRPPRLLLRGRFIGYLTTNRSKTPRVDPYAVLGYLQYHS